MQDVLPRLGSGHRSPDHLQANRGDRATGSDAGL